MVQKKNLYKVIIFCCIFLLSFQQLVLAAESIRIDIISINDFHGALLEEGKTPGAAKLAGMMNKLRKENPHGTIILSAGDMFQGTVRSNILYGKPVIEIMNYMGFSGMALGNHEFDWGLDVLRARAREAKFPMLAANITNKASGTPVDFAMPFTVEKINGVKVGIIGITTPETAYTSNISIVSKYNFAASADTVKKVYRKAKEAGAEIVIVLGHIGSAEENGAASGEAVELLSALNGSGYKIDALISAHTHNIIRSKPFGVPLVQAGHSGRNIGTITLYYSPEEKRVVKSFVDVLPVDAKQTPDRKVEKIVARSAKKARPVENTVIGQTEGLEHDRHMVSPMGMWAADAMKQAVNADIALTNGGGLRKPFLPGKITLGNIYDVVPFDNTIVTMQMTGRQIKEILEYGLDSELGAIQYSGVDIVYDRSAPKGAKIAFITLTGDRAFGLDTVYTVCTNDFLADGGDGYVFFKQGKNIKNTNIVLRSVLADAVKKVEKLVFKNDGRFLEKTTEASNMAA